MMDTRSLVNGSKKANFIDLELKIENLGLQLTIIGTRNTVTALTQLCLGRNGLRQSLRNSVQYGLLQQSLISLNFLFFILWTYTVLKLLL